jgi:F-type H+-transporting ATPase subunit b
MPGVRVPPPGGAHGPTAGPSDSHGAPSADAHGGEHHLGPINWAFGLLGEKEGVEPDLMTRRKGMPVPFLANLINFAVLAYLGVRFGGKPLTEGLKKRKQDIMRDIDEAGKTRAEAEDRLSEYEGKLAKIDDELTRIKREYAEQGGRDKDRILQEARERRARMKRDAEMLVEQEGKSLEKSMLEQTVARATSAAEDLIKQRLGGADQDRLADEYLKDVARVGGPS